MNNKTEKTIGNTINLTLKNYDAHIALEENKRPSFIVNCKGKTYILGTYGWQSLLHNRRVKNPILIKALDRQASKVLKKIIKEAAPMFL